MQTGRLDDNVMNITDLSCHFGECENRIIIRMAGDEHTIRLGKGKWVFQDGTIQNVPSKLAASAVWSDGTTFIATLRYIETPFVTNYIIHFEGTRVILKYRINLWTNGVS